jgi:hypothetical protein
VLASFLIEWIYRRYTSRSLKNRKIGESRPV